MKKGFTLVELLGVITVLAIIGLIAIPVVNKTIKDSKNKAYDAQIKEIENSTRSWVAEHLQEIDMSNIDCSNTDKILVQEVTLTQLKQGRYIESDEKNPKTNQLLTGKVNIVFECDYNSYEYSFVETN